MKHECVSWLDRHYAAGLKLYRMDDNPSDYREEPTVTELDLEEFMREAKARDERVKNALTRYGALASVFEGPHRMYDPGAHQLASEAWQDFYAHEELEGFHAYQSPFAGESDSASVRSLDYASHLDWLVQRSLYESSGSPERLEELLKLVTLTSPVLVSWPNYDKVTFTEDTMTS